MDAYLSETSPGLPAMTSGRVHDHHMYNSPTALGLGQRGINIFFRQRLVSQHLCFLTNRVFFFGPTTVILGFVAEILQSQNLCELNKALALTDPPEGG